VTSAIELGKAYARYRAKQGFSQKNPQQWAKCKNLMLHDSQIAYFEVGKKNYEPKSQFWLSLEEFNLALANKDMPPTQDGFDKKTRDRLLNAEPFLTAEGKPAEALDFYAMFIGKKPIPEDYKTTVIYDETAKRYTKLLREEFHKTRRELMITGKEVVEKLCQTNIGKKVAKKDVDFLIDVITEEKDFTSKHMQYLMDEYGTLPCLTAIQEITKSPKLQKFGNELGIK
jgi:hypothetical protein